MCTRLAIRKKKRYFKKVIRLHDLLRQKYTDGKTFTPGQVRTAFVKTKIPNVFLNYAYALYTSKSGFDMLHNLSSSSKYYDELRCEISDIYFKGLSNLVGTEGITDDFEKLNRYPQQWHSGGSATLGGS